jgi:type I restriction enzyme M protein
MRRSGRASAIQYVPELTWIVFLRILDEKEEREKEKASKPGVEFHHALEYPYRWQDWSALPDCGTRISDFGLKNKELYEGTRGSLKSFVNDELIPYLKNLKDKPGASHRQKIISEIFSSIEKTGIDTESDLLEVVSKINELSLDRVDETHMFTVSQVYEGLLQKMGEKNSDGGQFFTPREIVRVMVKAISPMIGETVYDPCCGTGGFLVQAYEYMREKAKRLGELEFLKNGTFYGREKENLVYPIALANLLLHGIDEPHIWHGNTLTGLEFYGRFFRGSPELFDTVLTNPPFGGKEGKDAQSRFPFRTSSTQLLFLQHVMDSLKPSGRCGIVLDEGVLFRTNESAFVETKRRLLYECNLWCIVSLPARVFVNAGAGSKTNLLFFTKGEPTKNVWYYDLSDLNVTKRRPLTIAHFDDFFRLLPQRVVSERSWAISIEEIKDKNYDLKAINPNRKGLEDKRTPDELISIIEAQSEEIEKALQVLKSKLYSIE